MLTTFFYSSSKNILITDQNVDEDLDFVPAFASGHGLELNASKTLMVMFGGKNQRFVVLRCLNIIFGDQALHFSDTVKKLGFLMDHKMRFRENINNWIRLAYCSLKSLSSSRHVLNVNQKKNV